MKRSSCVTVWWRWAQVEQGKPPASTHWWRPWQVRKHINTYTIKYRPSPKPWEYTLCVCLCYQTVVSLTEKWEWTQKPLQQHRCSADSTLPQTTGLTAFSPPSGERHWKLKKVLFYFFILHLNNVDFFNHVTRVWSKIQSENKELHDGKKLKWSVCLNSSRSRLHFLCDQILSLIRQKLKSEFSLRAKHNQTYTTVLCSFVVSAHAR